MSLNETAELLGNVGEFVGAIVVVVTLAYLAVQVRRNAQTVEAATSHSITRSQNELNVAMATNPEMTNMVLRGMQDYASLDTETRMRFNAWMRGILNTYQDLHVQHSKGFASPGQWEVMQDFLSSTFANQNMRDWWSRQGARFVSPQFRDELNRLLEHEAS